MQDISLARIESKDEGAVTFLTHLEGSDVGSLYIDQGVQKHVETQLRALKHDWASDEERARVAAQVARSDAFQKDKAKLRLNVGGEPYYIYPAKYQGGGGGSPMGPGQEQDFDIRLDR